jgi:hypothetical protein
VEEMKKIVLVLLVLSVALVSCATSGTPATEPIVHSEVVDVPGVSQDDLFTRVNMWFVDAFKQAGSVIQFSDKGSGVVKGKYVGRQIVTGIYFTELASTLTVEVRDGRYRISFDTPMYQYVGDALNGMYARPTAANPVTTVELGEKAKEEWRALAASLKTSVLTSQPSW